MSFKNLIFLILMLISAYSWADNSSIGGFNKFVSEIKNTGNPPRPDDCCGGSTEVQKASKKLNLKGFANRLNSLPNKTARLCARGVRQSLNILFGHAEDYGEDKSRKFGRPAKEFNENVLAKWKVPGSCFKKVAVNNSGHTKDLDIRVMQPTDSSAPGHIEIYFKGVWYSDFKQSSSYWGDQYGKAWPETHKSWKNPTQYRFSACK
jgi:hypothetical protein